MRLLLLLRKIWLGMVASLWHGDIWKDLACLRRCSSRLWQLTSSLQCSQALKEELHENYTKDSDRPADTPLRPPPRYGMHSGLASLVV
jgi:hypothetical protein